MWRSTRGFTLIELVMAISILIMFASASTLAFPRFVDFYRVRQAQVTLSAALRKAQMNAYRHGGSWRVRVDTGVRIESASGDQWDCDEDPAVWVTKEIIPFAWGGVMVADGSRDCIVYGPSGRISGPVPEALADGADAPILVDSREVEEADLQWDPDTRYWLYWDETLTEATITIDVGELRSFQTVELGTTHFGGGGYTYPTEVQVRGSTGGAFSCLGDYTLTSPDGQSADLTPKGTGGCEDEGSVTAKCETNEVEDVTACRFPIPVTGRYQVIEIFMTKQEGMALYVDEVDLGDLYFTLTANRYSRTIAVNPVTGRVTIK